MGLRKSAVAAPALITALDPDGVGSIAVPAGKRVKSLVVAQDGELEFISVTFEDVPRVVKTLATVNVERGE